MAQTKGIKRLTDTASGKKTWKLLEELRNHAGEIGKETAMKAGLAGVRRGVKIAAKHRDTGDLMGSFFLKELKFSRGVHLSVFSKSKTSKYLSGRTIGRHGKDGYGVKNKIQLRKKIVSQIRRTIKKHLKGDVDQDLNKLVRRFDRRLRKVQSAR